MLGRVSPINQIVKGNLSTVDLHVDFPHQCHKHNAHLDLAGGNNRLQVDGPRMKKGGLDKFVAALYLGDKTQTELGPDKSWNAIKNQLSIVKGYPDLALLALEGGRLLNGSQERIQWLAQHGCAYITLTHNKSTEWADSATDSIHHNGLSSVGTRIVKWIEDSKILVDVSHASDQTIMDVLSQATRPVIASHSGVRNLVDHPRNLSDTLIKLIAESGGVIGIPYASKFVTDVDGVILAIDHIAQLLGTTRHLAIGSDLDGAETVIEDVQEWSSVLQPLFALGYTVDQVDGIKGENFLRLLEENKRG